jgi:hypothetical protein
MSCKKPCQRCIDILERAASALSELNNFRSDELPPFPQAPTNYRELAEILVLTAGHLRRHNGNSI